MGLTLHPAELLVLLLAIFVGITTAYAWAGFIVQAADRQVATPWHRDRIAALSREALFRAFFGLFRLPGRYWPLPLGARGDRSAVLLVPDPDWGRGSMVPLAIALAHRGHRVRIVRWTLPEAELTAAATFLEDALRDFASSQQRQRVDIVAFGYGGVIAGWMMRHRTGGEVVRRLIALAAPWRGTRMAVFRRGVSGDALRPDSVLLHELLPIPGTVYSVWTTDDPAVVPAESAIAEPAYAIGIEGTGHLGLLLSARVVRAVATALVRELPEPAVVPPEGTDAASGAPQWQEPEDGPTTRRDVVGRTAAETVSQTLSPPIALPPPADGSDSGTHPATDATGEATTPGGDVEDPDATLSADEHEGRDDDTAASPPSSP